MTAESQTRIERAAENAHLKLWSRLMMAAGLPIGLAAASAAAAWIISTTNENTKALIRQGEAIETLSKVQIPNVLSLLNSRLDAQAQRLDSQDRKNEAQDAAIDRLRERIYSNGKAP